MFVPYRVKWPHKFVLAGQNKAKIRTVTNLLDDATDFSWASAKASHAVLLCRMEQGEIVGWDQTEKIDRVKRAHAQRHVVGQGSAQRVQARVQSRVFSCIYFNKGACLQKQTHENKGVTYTFVLTAGIKKVNFSATPRWSAGGSKAVAKMIFKKRVSMGTSIEGHTQVTRFFTNASTNALEVCKLLSMNVSQAKGVADRALAFSNTRNNRSFAAVFLHQHWYRGCR